MNKPTIKYLKEQNCLHIEANGCIINIRQYLYDIKERSVTSVEIIPDDHHIGEKIWKLYGTRNNRIVQLKKIK